MSSILGRGVICAAFALATSSCGDPLFGSTDEVANAEIVVFAAASLSAAFTELGEAFADQSLSAGVSFNFAASSDLASQIVEGAPADVFASADRRSIEQVMADGSLVGDPVVFAGNRMEIIVEPGNPQAIRGVADLSRPDLVVVICAAETPCGRYAEAVFAAAGVAVAAKSLEQNVNAVVTKVTLGEADAGVVYRTDVVAAAEAADGVEIPDGINGRAEYPIAVTTETGNQVVAQAFVDFVTGRAGQAILASYGFLPP